MAKSHDRAARLVAKILDGEYDPTRSPDVKGRDGSAEVKSSANEIPKALRQLTGHRGTAFVVLPQSECREAQEHLRYRKTGLMNYKGNIIKPSIRK